MDFDQYQADASAASIFVKLAFVKEKTAKEFMWGYPLIGIAGEASEVIELLQKIDEAGETSPEIRQQLVGEAGDVLWNVAAYTAARGFSLGDIAKLGMDNTADHPTIHDFQSYVIRKEDMEEPGFQLMKAAVGLFDHTRIGAIMEESKRTLRDDKLEANPERDQRIKTAIANVLVTITLICSAMGITLDEAAENNIEKCRSIMASRTVITQ